LNDKVVLITRAAGGIGAATARELYALGASLVLTDLRPSQRLPSAETQP
jgi:NAD(P)-dependent dehydrogenase (short-subunit alcohol dehydrogenase family)